MRPRPTGRSSARHRPSPTSAEDFALAGPSTLPDPKLHAYRKDLADIALAGLVIASHYAEPALRMVNSARPLLAAPDADSEVIGQVSSGDSFEMLDDSLGWAWGYAGGERRVGYLPSEAVS